MGLDMYLTAKKYVGNWNHSEEHEKKMFASIVEAADMGNLINKESNSLYIQLNVAYWRKANAIHRWFVNTIADGKDDYSEIYVTRDDIKTLVELCKDIINKERTPAETLPTTSGFFFGTTEYDDNYMYDLESTIEQLEPLLDEVGYDFYYQASW